MRTLVFVLVCWLGASPIWAQQDGFDSEMDSLFSDNRIELRHADELIGGIFTFDEEEGPLSINRLLGHVEFFHEGTTITCDSAYLYRDRNAFEGFSNIVITQGDSVRMTGDTLSYDGDVKTANMRGEKVVFQDGTMTLTTTQVDYQLEEKIAYYTQRGFIVDEETELTSVQGYYDVEEKMYSFKDSVYLINPEYRLWADTLRYGTETKIAFFEGPTFIFTADSNQLYAEGGEYHTEKQRAYFNTNAWVETPKYRLEGDTLFYNNVSDDGFAEGHVRLFSLLDSILIEGEEATRNGKTKVSRVLGEPLVKNYSDPDTLFMAADTLISYGDTATISNKLLAYHDVRVLKTDMQAVCDSLVHDVRDSTLYLYTKPIVWNNDNQLTADSMRMQMANGFVDKAFARYNSFLIGVDTLGEYNQVKGRHMTARFDSGSIYRVDVEGNGECIYHALEGDSVLVGLNYVQCSDMIIRIVNNDITRMTFLKEPTARFIPPREIMVPDRTLNGFIWQGEKRPERTDLPFHAPRVYEQPPLPWINFVDPLLLKP